MVYGSGEVQRIFAVILSLFGFGAITGCATASIGLDSVPNQAEVYAQPLGGGEPALLGKTPLNLRAPEILKQTGGSGPVLLEFRKNGYNAHRAVITDLSPVDLNLKVALLPMSGLEDQDRMNQLIDTVFEAQRLALSGRFEDATAQVKRVQKEAPQMAAAYEIEGGIYFLQNRLTEALDAYRIAARFNPANPETTRMRNFLEDALGVGPQTTKGKPKQ